MNVQKVTTVTVSIEETMSMERSPDKNSCFPKASNDISEDDEAVLVRYRISFVCDNTFQPPTSGLGKQESLLSNPSPRSRLVRVRATRALTATCTLQAQLVQSNNEATLARNCCKTCLNTYTSTEQTCINKKQKYTILSQSLVTTLCTCFISNSMFVLRLD